MTRHLKRYHAPKSWSIERKRITFITRPHPGSQKRSVSVPLVVLLRDMLGLANTLREARYILHHSEVKVDGIRRKDPRYAVGLFDVVSVGDTVCRLSLTTGGHLIPVILPASETTKICQVANKTMVKGKVQVNLHDGKNMLVDKAPYAVGDTVVVDISKQPYAVKEHIKLEKNAFIFLIAGTHKGHTGVVQDIQGKKIIYKLDDGSIVETLKSYAFAVGKTKPVITLSAK